MNVEQLVENKTDEVLSFRIESIDIKALETGLKMLNPAQAKRVKKSDLARKAFRRGLSLAMQEEIQLMEQEEKQRQELERAKGFEPSTFTLANCMPINLALAMLDSTHSANSNSNGTTGQSGTGHFSEACPDIGQPVRKARSLRRDHIAVH
jgi:hypothetical protein